MNRFEGRVALVAGASRGIAVAVAQQLVDEGAEVVMARKPEALAAVVERLGAQRAVAVAGNAADPARQDDALRSAIERFGSLDLLVDSCGINPAYGPLMELDLDGGATLVEGSAIGG